MIEKTRRFCSLLQARTAGQIGGAAADHTIGHLHVHLLPHFKADLSDDRGEERWATSENAAYWSKRG